MPLPNRSTISTYDADNKINLANIPPAVQQTDWDNTKLAPAISDVVGLGLVSPRFWARLTLADSTGDMVLNNWQAVWSNVTTTTPILAKVTTGQFTITLPTTVSDEYDASVGTTNNITLNLLASSGKIEGSTFGFINCSASGNVISINTADHTGSANDLAGVTVFVTAY
jgi:hypothetical protein